MHADLHRCMLAESNTTHFDLRQAQSVNEAETCIGHEHFEVMLLDLTLPDSQGLGTYMRAKAVAPALPIIVLTGTDDQQTALQAVRSGAQDYLVKGQVDGRMLSRVIRYAIERKRAQDALRDSEEFFRLISENVHDLIAVIDRDGCWLYNSPSYRDVLGEPDQLRRANAFAHVHPEDRERVVAMFRATLATGAGQRMEYRLLGPDGCVRHIEAQSSVIRDDHHRIGKVVLVSRDVTRRKESVATLRSALADLRVSHDQLQATQQRLSQSEKLEAISTFAAGVAHEVRNPLQAILLGVDYLAGHISGHDRTAHMVLADLGQAVQRADGILRGLVEMAVYKNCATRDEDLNEIVQQALPPVHSELVNARVRLVLDLAEPLPRLRLDARTMKHAFINLLVKTLQSLPDGGTLTVRTAQRQVGAEHGGRLALPPHYQPEDTIVTAELEARPHPLGPLDALLISDRTSAPAGGKINGLGLTVLKKIIELHGGMVQLVSPGGPGGKLTIIFRPSRKQTG